ncbi:U3 snoRNP protein [Apophysomyces ossiformis]|uniref:U3 snoRNP protein n=1 Tax=Apophysomyces ossiformis TaxID=679940 RepID=A0A8H7BKM1_9FUNG|nr:U3 snoRNP protein [Apophysomyces ossiformis]
MKDNTASAQLNTGQGTNRFKFQSFNSRVDSLKVDIVRRSRLVEEDPDSHGSFFNEALESWKELNLTRHFSIFAREITPYAKSLPSIVYHKEKIVEILEKHLKVPESMALDGLLEKLSKLLGEDHKSKPYIRHFTAEAFAFLLRKARGKDLEDIVRHILASLRSNATKEYEEGLAMLFFECIKQVDHRMHSRGEAIYKVLLHQSYEELSEDLAANATYQLLSNTTLLVLHHTYREHFTPVITLLLREIDTILKGQSLDAEKLLILVSLLALCVTVRKSSRIQDPKPIIERLQKITSLLFTSKQGSFPQALYVQTLRTITGVLCFGTLEVIVGGGRSMLQSVISYDDAVLVYGFFLGLAKLEWSNFTQVTLPYVIKYASEKFSTYPQETVLFLSELVASNALTINSGMLSSSVTAEGLLRFPMVKNSKSVPNGILDILSATYDWAKERNRLNETSVTEIECSNVSSIAVISAALNLVPSIQIPFDDAFKTIVSLYDSLLSFLATEAEGNDVVYEKFVIGRKNFVLEALLGLSIESLARMAATQEGDALSKLRTLQESVVSKVLALHGHNETILRGVFKLMDLFRSSIKEDNMFSLEKLEIMYPLLKNNLSSYHRNCRLYTMKILALYDQPLMKKDAQHPDDEPCGIVELAVDMEEIVPTMKDFRDKLLCAQKIQLAVSSERIPDLFKDFAPLLSLGLLTMNLRPMWEEAKKILATSAKFDRELYWNLCFSELAKFDEEKLLVRDGFPADVVIKSTSPLTIDSGHATKTRDISFECPTYNKYTQIEDKAWSIVGEEKAASYAMLFVKLCAQEKIRVDFWNYHNLILTSLKENSAIAEQRSRHLIPIFFRFLEHEFESVATDDIEDESHEKSGEKLGILHINSRITKTKMANWLELFAAFENPRVLFKSEQLHGVFLRLIAKGDSKLQSAALECILTWKDPKIKPYADNLRNLMNETRFRDELSTFVQNEEQNMIDPAHRDGLMPIVMRILFGRLVQRKSIAASKSSKTIRRYAILSAVACCHPPEIRFFFGLALESFSDIVDLPGETKDEEGVVTSFSFMEEGSTILQDIAWRKQVGLLMLMEDIIKQMGSHIMPFLAPLLKVVMYIIYSAYRRETVSMDIDAAEDSEEVEEAKGKQHSKRSKEVKALALKRIVDFFKLSGKYDFTPYLPAMFETFISPRLEVFPLESSQNMSILLQLFVVWSERVEYVPFLVDYDARVLPQVYAILSAKSLNEHVLSNVLDLVENSLNHCSDEMEVDDTVSLKQKLIVPHVDLLLSHLKYRLTQSKDDVKFGSGRYSIRQIAIVERVAPYTSNGEQAAVIVDLLLPSLNKPVRIVPETTKEHILSTWARFIRIIPGLEAGSHIYQKYYSTASLMFSMIRSRNGRRSLVDIIKALADINPHIVLVSELLDGLNSYSQKRVQEMDYDSMLDALNKISDDLYDKLDHHQWLPLLHQCIYTMQDPEEMAIRGSSTHCVTRFLTFTKNQDNEEEKRRLMEHVNHLIYPAIKRGLTLHVELIRIEFVNLLDAAIKMFPELPIFEDLVPLLGSGDEEVNFFANIYHMQLHRRVRALSRLASMAPTENFKASSVNSILLPIVTSFFYENDRVADHNLIHQCIVTLTELARLLPWSHYYRLLRNYLALIAKKEEMEKTFVRVVIGILDAFHFDLRDVEVTEENALKIMGRQKAHIEFVSSHQIAAEVRAKAEQENKQEAKEQENEEEEEEEELEKGPAKSQPEKIHDILISKLLPELNKYLNNNKTRQSVLSRVPMALGIAKLLRSLPEKSMRLNLPGLLISLCQIIRSRAQDVRDVTRDTLLKINAYLGPSYFSFIVKELRTSLTKGYELHVLGFTVNALLDDMLPRLKVGDLDKSVEVIVQVLVNDIFGITGQEKDVDELAAKTKEAKSRRSPQSFESLGTIVHFKNVGLLLLPLKEIMSKTESLKVLKKVDDILRRVSAGLVRNPEFDSQELLDFAHGLISENVDTYKPAQKVTVNKTQREKNFEVQMKRMVEEPVDHYRTNAHRFVYFGLSLFFTAIKRNKLDIQDPESVIKLDPFVDVVGNALYSNHMANVALAAKIMASLCRMPLPTVPQAVPVVIKRTFSLIKSTGNTNSPLVQSCFKLLTVCIRDTKQSSLTEHQLTYLINLIRPDMEEPDRQSTVFSLIRAIVSRKFVAPEMYDLMDTVAQIMITNQTKEIREQARSVFFLFLMDYPQGHDRLKKQMAFIIKNLEYMYESGRESIMELLHQIINKFGDEILEEFSDGIFLALVMRLVNDESAKCREMAAELIKNLMERLEDNMNTIYKALDTWLDQSKKQNLQRAACQVYGLVVDAFGTRFKQAPMLVERLTNILQIDHENEQEEDMEIDIEWEVAYYCLNTFSKVAKVFPKLVYTSDATKLWQRLEGLLLHPHTWIRSSAARLYGVYFASIDAQTRFTPDGEQSEYLVRSKLRSLATKFVEQLKSKHLSEDLATQIVKNLFFIGKCFYFMSEEEDLDETTQAHEDADEEKAVGKASLHWLFRRVSFTTRGAAISHDVSQKSAGIVLRSAAFRWFAAMCNMIPGEELPPYLVPVIAPVYRTVEDKQTTTDGFEDLKRLGNELLSLLQKRAGSTVYFAAYQSVRQKVNDAKQERKAKRAIERMNPKRRAADEEKPKKKNKKLRV